MIQLMDTWCWCPDGSEQLKAQFGIPYFYFHKENDTDDRIIVDLRTTLREMILGGVL